MLHWNNYFLNNFWAAQTQNANPGVTSASKHQKALERNVFYDQQNVYIQTL